MLVLGADEAEAVAVAAIARQERGKQNEGRVRAGEKLGDISGATKMVLDALAAAKNLIDEATKISNARRTDQ